MKASKIISKLEKIAPLNLQEHWDNSGLQIGNRGQEVTKILTTLNITPEVVHEAINKDADMIVSHHPFFFQGMKSIDFSTAKGNMIEDIIKNDIVVYSAHTNLDKSSQGINYYLGRILHLRNLRPLKPDNTNFGYYKLIIYAPEEAVDSIRNVIHLEELGKTGPLYSDCTFRTEGIGTFRPLDYSKPYIGDTNKIEQVKEIKLETIVPKNKIDSVLQKIKKVHPYQEMAYDLFPVEIKEVSTKEGLGVIGTYEKSKSISEFIKILRAKFKNIVIKQAGKHPSKIKKVAICTGAGADMIRTAKSKNADVLITGDLKHHDGQLAKELNLWVLDVGHYGTEQYTRQLLKKLILKDIPEEEKLEIIESEKDEDFLRVL